MEPRYKEHLWNEVLGITSDIPHPIDRKVDRKAEPRYKESSLWRTHFASLLPLRYIKIAPYLIEGYLTIIPRARMGSESIAHSAFGLMGY